MSQVPPGAAACMGLKCPAEFGTKPPFSASVLLDDIAKKKVRPIITQKENSCKLRSFGYNKENGI